MAPRNIDNDAARDIVSESFGISLDDVGMSNEDMLAHNDEGDDLDQDDNLDQDDGNDELNAGDDDFSPEPQPQPQRRQQERQPNQQRQPQQPQNRLQADPNKQQKGEFDVDKIKYDAKGNILSADGKRIIANAGREARMFTTLHKRTQDLSTIREAANHAISEVDNRLKQAVEIGTNLHNQLEQLRQNATEYQRAGLTDSENREAVELASMFKRSPVEAIKTMLTRAAARGIDMTSLGLQPGGFDPAALMALVQQRLDTGLAPVKQFTEQSAQQRQQQNQQNGDVETAKRELSTFLISNPEARQYLPVIQKVYENPEFANMSLNEVWLRIQLNLARNQQQRQRNGGHPTGRLRNRQQGQQPRLPTGRGSPGGGGNGDGGRRVDLNEPAPVTESYEAIVRSVMNAAG